MSCNHRCPKTNCSCLGRKPAGCWPCRAHQMIQNPNFLAVFFRWRFFPINAYFSCYLVSYTCNVDYVFHSSISSFATEPSNFESLILFLRHLGGLKTVATIDKVILLYFYLFGYTLYPLDYKPFYSGRSFRKVCCPCCASVNCSQSSWSSSNRADESY